MWAPPAGIGSNRSVIRHSSSGNRRTKVAGIAFGRTTLLGRTGSFLNLMTQTIGGLDSTTRVTPTPRRSHVPIAVRMQQWNELFGLVTIILNTLFLGFEAEVRMRAANKNVEVLE